MLIFYDVNGTIVTQDTARADVIGGLNYLEINEMPINKVLNRVDVTVTPHQPVFINQPKTEMEMLRDTVNMCMGMLSTKDTMHDVLIKNLTFEVKKLNTFINENFKIQ